MGTREIQREIDYWEEHIKVHQKNLEAAMREIKTATDKLTDYRKDFDRELDRERKEAELENERRNAKR